MALPDLWPFARRRYSGYHYVDVEFESANKSMELLAAAKRFASFDESTHLPGSNNIVFRFSDGNEAMLFKLSA